MRKLSIGLVLVLCVSFFFVACTRDDKKPNNPNDVKATTVKIYVDESNIHGIYVKGSEENKVKAAIEAKFFADTGKKINLDMQYLSHATFGSQFGPVKAASEWDAAVSYIGQAGLEDTTLPNRVTMDLSEILDNYEYILKVVGEDALQAVTMLDNEVVGIPSVNKTKMKGILARKDFMLKVGYTDVSGHNDDLGAINQAPGNKLKTLRTIDDFTDMLRRVKQQIPGCINPIMGKPHDIEFTITGGAYGTAGYQYKEVIYEADNTTIKEVVPGWISQNYSKVLDYEFMLQNESLWEKDFGQKSKETRLTDYVNGKGVVYCEDPNILNLINVARRGKEADKNAQFVILNPLDAPGGAETIGTGAYAEVSRTSDCLIINKKSKNAELLLSYINWMYSDVSNYELCMYGIKDLHWVDAGAGYYSYPKDKEDRYMIAKPYSGIFALVHNDEFSYRLFSNYTEEEKSWIQKVENAKTFKNPADGMLFYNMPADVGSDFNGAEGKFYIDCVTKVWSGDLNPRDAYAEFGTSYRAQAAKYIDWLTKQYKLYLTKRS